jgi:hypothetical protein
MVISLVKLDKKRHIGGGGGLKSAEKCHVLFEWPLTKTYQTDYII